MTLAIDRCSSTRSLIADDPLIAGMSIRQSLPLHESSARLRELYPECPRAYGVAVMSDVGRRRWWPLARALNTDRLERMYARAIEETGSDAVAVHQLADALVHTVVGRLVALVVLEGRAWDPG
ncbi:MAG: iron reductase, partial [[Mycobacterium] stephanolepidis]